MQTSAINLLDNPFALLSNEEYEWGEEYQNYDDLYDDGYSRKYKINILKELHDMDFIWVKNPTRVFSKTVATYERAGHRMHGRPQALGENECFFYTV